MEGRPWTVRTILFQEFLEFFCRNDTALRTEIFIPTIANPHMPDLIAQDDLQNLRAAGLSQTLTYDPVTGHLSAVTDPFGHSLTFAYDANGRLSTMTDPNGGITTYTYDDTNNVGNLSTVTYPDGKFKSYKYNEPGYVAAYTNFPHALTGIVDENNNRYASLT